MSIDFKPDWASPPGDTIRDLLEKRGFSLAEFANLISTDAETTNRLLLGHIPITIGLAKKLEKTIGGPLEFWVARDYLYREDLAALYGGEEEWLANMPTKDMAYFGWTTNTFDVELQLKGIFEFFGLKSIREIRMYYSGLLETTSFRKSKAFSGTPAALATWLRKGEIEANKIPLKSWAPETLLNSIATIKSLTRERSPRFFLRELTKICADSGLAVAIARAPSGSGASGAAYRGRDGKHIILLSFRYLSDDQLWFTFFHELAHSLQENSHLFVETELSLESEANKFAENILIPDNYRGQLRAIPHSDRAIVEFARRLGVSPGIIVGQLQHHKLIKQNHFNYLKRRFSWEQISREME